MDTMTGKNLIAILSSGCANLNNNKDAINALNVFPVPDGDTGTNMSLTFTNGITEMNKTGSESIPILMKSFSRGLLMGARGNSGVILSQIFRGFYQSVKEKEELTTADLNDAVLNGKQMAYKAVMRPVEGTILTVIRESSDAADLALKDHPEMSIEEYFEVLTASAKTSLEHTPDLLPVLKEANVVDSGGSGLTIIFGGFLAALQGKPIQASSETQVSTTLKTEKSSGYRAEYILQFDERGKLSFNEERVRKNLEKMGNQLTLIHDGDLLKVRINTMSPGEILTLGQRYGDFKSIQIENIQDDLKPSIIDETSVKKELKEYGLITVCAGKGLSDLFANYHVDTIISGGQTMNPSTSDFVQAINDLNAKHIYILPNNSNIILAAKQAAEVIQDKDIIIIESTTIPQGLSACMAFNPDVALEDNTTMMKEALSQVKSGSITYAIKDTTNDGIEIHKDDYMGILEKKIVCVDPDCLTATKALLNEMCDEETQIVMLFAGEEAQDDDNEKLISYIEENLDIEVEFIEGNQPVYRYLISAE